MINRTVKPVKLKDFTLDGKKIYIQSMLCVPSNDIEGNVRQAIELEKAGCEILRVAIPDEESLKLIPAIKNVTSIPLVADIHYDYVLAIASAEMGIDKIRINPGNIGNSEKVKLVADECRRRKIPIRIGVNSGSLDKRLLEKYGSPTAEALVESALEHASLLTMHDFDDIVISIKSSNVPIMVNAYRLIA
ncbi:MAG: flavodoxin-dependent (E)-4-hydroxy-3-methylbut-2-enyl-diphosphate synthase, partial [Oscillospiraceae bacterium]